jgi:hypothetical protein
LATTAPKRVDGRHRPRCAASASETVLWCTWTRQRLHERLSRLANRVTDAAKVLGAIHARIPMVTPDEIQAAKIEAAEAAERCWSRLHDGHTGQMEGHGQLIAKAEGKIAAIKVEAEKCAAKVAEAKDRAERLKRGEDVASGLAKPPNMEKMLRDSGWTTRDINHARWLSEVCDAFGNEGVFKRMFEESSTAERREERRIVRRLKRHLDRLASEDDATTVD